MMVRPHYLVALLLSTTPALAQTPQSASPANPTVPIAPPNATSPPPEKMAPSDGSLSNHLSQQQGTITPPNVDPGMRVGPPQTSSATMPVIPPPGSPGGSDRIIPK